MRITIAALVLLMLSCNSKTGEKQATKDSIVTIPPNLVDTLLYLQQEEDRAETEKDFTTLDRILSPAFTMTRVDGETWTREQLYKDIRSMSNETYEDPIYDQVKVVSSNDTAYMQYRVGFANQGVNGSDTLRYDMNSIWLRDTTWKIIRLSVKKFETD